MREKKGYLTIVSLLLLLVACSAPRDSARDLPTTTPQANPSPAAPTPIGVTPTPAGTTPTPTGTPLPAQPTLLTSVAILSSTVEIVWQCAPTMDWHPDEQVLAYAGAGVIWTADAPDFRPQRAMERSIQPKWRPDGRGLAGLWSDPKRWYLQELDLQTGMTWTLQLVEKTLYIDRWLNNEQLALVIHRGVPGEVLYAASPRLGTLVSLVSPEDGTLSRLLGGRFIWSPNPRYLAVEYYESAILMIAVIDVDNHRETYLGDRDSSDYQKFESWAPQGTSLLYAQWAGSPVPLQETPPRLLKWDSAEEKAREVLPNVWGAAWSPKGNQFAFVLMGNPAQDEQGNIVATDLVLGQPFELFVGLMERDTQTPPILIPAGQVVDGAAFVESFVEGPFGCGWPRPLWSPDGSLVLYWDAQAQLWAMTSEGQDRQPLAEPGDIKYALWSSDGNYLALRTNEQVIVMRLHVERQ